MTTKRIAAVALSLLIPCVASAADVKVIASGATKEAYTELVPVFEKKSGHKIATTWSGSADIKRRIEAGEVYDLVIVPAPLIDVFVRQSKIVPGSRVDLMKSGIGAAVRAGAPKPDIQSSDALKRTVLAAKSIGYSTGPSGTYVVSLFERMGIAEQVKSKLKQVPSGMRIATLISNGEAEIGFQQISELVNEPGIDYLGPLPSDVQQITVFAAGVHTEAKEPDAAKALAKYLSAPAAAPAIKKHGMEP